MLVVVSFLNSIPVEVVVVVPELKEHTRGRDAYAGHPHSF